MTRPPSTAAALFNDPTQAGAQHPEPETPADGLAAALVRHYTGGPGHKDEDSHLLYRELAAPGSNRRIDLLAVSVWESRGRSIDAHEIKVSRSDWLRELQQPGKAEAWWPYCTRFWLVVPHESIVHTGELPAGWGLMVPPKAVRQRKMRVIIRPEQRQPQVTLDLLAKLLNRDRQDAARLTREHEEEVQRLTAELNRTRWRAQDLEENRTLSDTQRDRLALLDRIERAIGGPLTRAWYDDRSPEAVGLALRFVQAGRKFPSGRTLADMQRASDDLASGVCQLRALVDEVRLEEPH